MHSRKPNLVEAMAMDLAMVKVKDVDVTKEATILDYKVVCVIHLQIDKENVVSETMSSVWLNMLQLW